MKLKFFSAVWFYGEITIKVMDDSDSDMTPTML